MKRYKPKKTKFKRFGMNKRESSSKRGYDFKWHNYRKKFLAANPKCYICGFRSNVVDHIIAWKIDKEKYFWDTHNFMPLCEICHNTVTGKFDRFKVPDFQKKIEWIIKQREKNNVSVKIKIVDI